MNKKGFTLIELLVVIAIIGLLSTLAVVSLNNARSRSRDAKRVADVKQMQTAFELYYNEQGGYPVQDPLAAVTGIAGSMATYMQAMPTAPTPADGTTCTAANNAYRYRSASATGAACAAAPCASYRLAFCLGGTTGELTGGEKCATPSGISSTACGAW